MKSTLNRRTFLQASGVALALPWLESMRPAVARSSPEAPRRLVFICTTLGLHPPSFWPKGTENGYGSSEYLDLLSAHRRDFTLFSGLAHDGQAGRQGHSCEMTWLTAARNPGLDGFRNTISVDQLAAETMGTATRFPSVVLGSHTSLSQSYTSRGVMIPAETSPASLFAQLFLQGNPSEVERQKQKLSDGRSILDGLGSQTRHLRRTASSSDTKMLDEYFESVRKAEQDLNAARAWMDRPKPTVAATPPTDIADPADLIGRTQLLLGLIPLIVQTDSSRVVSIMIQDHQVVPKVAGVSTEHHTLSHHGQNQAKIDQLKQVEKGLVGCFGDLLDQLKHKTEAGGNLLARTSVLFGSNLGNANSHDARNLPIILAGGGFAHGRHVARDKTDNFPLCDLFVTMLNQAGVETDSFAQSAGRLTW